VHSWNRKAFLHPSCSFAPNTSRFSTMTEPNVSPPTCLPQLSPSLRTPYVLVQSTTITYREVTTHERNPLHSTSGPHFLGETCFEGSTRSSSVCEHSNHPLIRRSCSDGGLKLYPVHNTHLMILPSGLSMDGFLMEVVPILGFVP
jgi:hypothetical protein